MRRLTLILTLAVVCLAGVVVIPSASAGNFDAELMHCVGEDPATCPGNGRAELLAHDLPAAA